MLVRHWIRTFVDAAQPLAAAALALLLLGCSGSGGGAGGTGTPSSDATSPTSGCGDCGAVLLAVTDADGDFVSYSVDVLSVTLERRNGASVEALPGTTRIDFAQLTDLADLLSVTTMAAGDIVGGKIRLDYGSAEVFVEAGGEIVPARVVGSDGQPLGVTEVEIRLAERQHLVVTRARAALLSLDFDLHASHAVDVGQTPAVVTAQPYIVAEAMPVEEKELRLRGALVDVNVAAGTYSVDVRPWHRRDGNHGRITVHTTGQTTFEIAAESYTGAAGLRALSAQPAGTLTVAFGTLDVQNREFTAQIVHAGDSVSGERIDAVHGNIVARSGDQLTVKGAFAVRRDRAARFHRTVIVQVGPETKVLKMGTPGVVLDDQSLSVGQAIVAFGTFGDPTAADRPPVLDATQSRVRMLVTHLHGSVAGVLPGQLNLRLRAIDRLGIEMFDFSGTGMTPALDADPLNYEVSTATLALDAAEQDAPAKVLGFVRPFGAAPADFEGRTVIDRRDLPSALGIGWGMDGTTAPFLSMDATGLVLDLNNPSIGERHHMLIGRRKVDLFDLPASPTIAPAQGRMIFGLVERGHIELFADFNEFARELAEQLGGGNAAQALAAYGSYDEASNTLTANRIAVHLHSAN
jgi:hypothetical protein